MIIKNAHWCGLNRKNVMSMEFKDMGDPNKSISLESAMFTDSFDICTTIAVK